MYSLLVSIGLILSTFTIIPGCDVRDVQMDVSLCCAVILILLAIYKGSISEYKNKWLLVLIAYLPIQMILSPSPDIKLFGMQVGNFWQWETLSKILIFGMMMVSIASYKFTEKEVRRILSIITICSFISGLYVILQFFRIDQFLIQINGGDDGRMTGTIGNPTLISSYMAMTIPICIYLRRWLFMIIIMIAVFMTESQFAIGSMILSSIIYLGVGGRKRLVSAILCILVIAILIPIGFKLNVLNDSSRFEHWPKIIADMNTPLENGMAKFPITGLGLGSFKYIYHIKHNNTYHEAHNEYIETAYTIGIVGIIFFVLGIFSIFKENYKSVGYRLALLASFLCVVLNAIGTFTWQVAAIIYQTMIVVGLIQNRRIE